MVIKQFLVSLISIVKKKYHTAAHCVLFLGRMLFLFMYMFMESYLKADPKNVNSVIINLHSCLLQDQRLGLLVWNSVNRAGSRISS